ncbi:MAG: phosphatase PAP2 family protein [Candidatus Heimdallarchaeaceae archaeon]
MVLKLQKISDWDRKITNRFGVKTEKGKKIWSFFALSGNLQPWLVVSIIFFVFDLFMERSVNIYQLIVIFSAGICTTILKFSIRRKRPNEDIASKYIANADIWSFPSGHAGRMGSMAMFMVLFFPKIGWLFIIWGLAVGYARMTLKIHYFLDIVAGLIIGGIVGIIGYFISPVILPHLGFFNQLIPPFY